jgi:hypothetical protein
VDALAAQAYELWGADRGTLPGKLVAIAGGLDAWGDVEGTVEVLGMVVDAEVGAVPPW